MTVKRIVTNIAAGQVEAARRFYGEMLGMTVVMDLGWIITFAGTGLARVLATLDDQVHRIAI